VAKLVTEHARRIAKTLNAIYDTSAKAHDQAKVWHDGKLVAVFGIRRGSKKDLGHGHIPHELHITPKECRALADCSMSREHWVQRMKDQGLL